MSTRKRNPKILIAVLAGLMAAGTLTLAQKKDEPEVLLQRAIQKEMVDGDLKAAIELYKKVAATPGVTARVAADALVHLGETYEKSGDAEARKTYERVIRDYSNQANATAQARRRLGALGNAASSDAFNARLICQDCAGGDASIDAEGRFMAITDWDSGDVAIRDLRAGTVRRLMFKSGTFKDSDEYSEWAELSPDSRQVVYLWDTAEKNLAKDDTGYELRMASITPGSKPRTLVRLKGELQWIDHALWSRDSRSVLTTLEKPDKTWQLAWVSLSDGTIKPLKSLGWRLKGVRGDRLALSRDGRYIAYAALSTNPVSATAPLELTDEHIYVLAADGSSPEIELIKSSGISESPIWMSDSNHLLFVSNVSGSYGLWSVAVQDGHATGARHLVRANTGRILPVGMTTSESFFYTQNQPGLNQVSIAQLRDGKVQKGQTVEGIVGYHATWSPDGQSIAFPRQTARKARVALEQTHDLVVYSLKTGEETLYNGPSGMEIRPSPPLWFHDGSAFLQGTQYGNTNVPNSFDRVDLKTGQFKPVAVLNDPTSMLTALSALSADDKTLFLAARDDKAPTDTPVTSRRLSRIVAIDLATGERKQIFSLPGSQLLGEMALSPDGHTFALAVSETGKPADTHIKLVATDGSNYREVYGPIGGRAQDKLAWTKDGRAILLGRRKEANSRNWEVVQVSVSGGKPEPIGLEVVDLESFELSPDGSRIAYDSKSNTVDELWTLDNIASLVKDPR